MLSWPFTYMPDPAPASIPEPSASTAPPGNPPATTPAKPGLYEAFNEGNEGYKRLWPFIAKYRKRFIGSIVAGAGSAALTAAQARVLQLVTHSAFHEGVDPAVAKAAPVFGDVILVSSLLPLVIMARCLCDYLENYYMTWVSLRVLHDMR